MDHHNIEPISTAKKKRILKESIFLLILFVILVIPLYFIVYKFSNAYFTNNESNIPIKGSGSDFGFLVYEDYWFKQFGNDEDIFITYEENTISQSLKHLLNETYKYSFAGGEVITNNGTLLSNMGIYQIPTVGASVIIIYNLPPNTIGEYRLNFTTDMLLQAYNGSLIYWDDIRIAQANYNIFPPLPHKTIIPLHFTAANGATLIFTSTLANFSSTWTQVGEEISWPLPINQTITKSSDMMLVASATPFSIGYVLYPYYLSYEAVPENQNATVDIISLCTQYNTSTEAPTCDNSIVYYYNLSLEAFANVTISANNVAEFPAINFTCSECWPFNGFTYYYVNTTYYYSSGCSLLLDNFQLFLDWIYTDEYALSSASLTGYVLLQSFSSDLSPIIDSMDCISYVQSPIPYALSGVLILAVILTFICIGRVGCIVNKKEKTESLISINGSDLDISQYESSPLLQKAKIGEDELIMEEQIGSGSFGEVYSGKWRGTRVAIKRMLFNINNPDHVEMLNDFKQEAYIMSTLRHPNIVQFLGASMQPPHLLIVTELAERGSLFDVLKNRSIKLSFHRKINFCIDAAKGMVYLHNCKPPVIHRDLKSANLLVDKHWQVRVTDFGLSRVVDNQKTMTHCGTVDFCAPEVLNRNRYSVKADAYSFTLCIWQIFTRQVLFPGMPLYQMMSSIVKDNLRPPTDKIDVPEIVELLKRGWDANPDARPTMEEFLEELVKIKEKYTDLDSSSDDEV